MQHAKIYLVDDSVDERDASRQALEKAGHQVVLEAQDLLGALTDIYQGRLRETGVQVAVLDSYLRGCFARPWDGEILAHAIRCLGLPIKIVSYNFLKAGQDGFGDRHVCKAEGEKVLCKAISTL